MTNNMVWESRLGLIMLVMKASTGRARRKARGSLISLMALATKGSSERTKSRGSESTSGQMEEYFRVIGNKIRCMVLGRSLGLTVANSRG